MDPWLVFDFLIVVTSWSLESLQVIRAFRSFRAFRLVTRIAPLRDLISAIGAVMPRIYAIMMLLMLVFYIFAVLFTELFGHLALSENYFATLEASLFTCMQFMTLSWSDVTRELMLFVPWAWLPVVSFIAITGAC
jgi:Ion transport protein